MDPTSRDECLSLCTLPIPCQCKLKKYWVGTIEASSCFDVFVFAYPYICYLDCKKYVHFRAIFPSPPTNLSTAGYAVAGRRQCSVQIKLRYWIFRHFIFKAILPQDFTNQGSNTNTMRKHYHPWTLQTAFS